ncbi:MAG TPA: chemotaxis protein CheW [Polyangia bacterium]|nr:chemotaxis protein CheW [Polyangia bacterium]
MAGPPLTWDAIRTGRARVATEASYTGLAAARRARSAAKAIGAGRELLSFRLAGEDYALDIIRIREIIKPAPLTEVPRAPAFVPGIISVRGTIVPVIDLRLRLRLHAPPPGKPARILIVSKDDDPYGLLVDEVRQVERLAHQDVEAPPAVIGGLEAEFIAGIGRAENKLLILLNLDAVLTFEVGP